MRSCLWLLVSLQKGGSAGQRICETQVHGEDPRGLLVGWSGIWWPGSLHWMLVAPWSERSHRSFCHHSLIILCKDLSYLSGLKYRCHLVFHKLISLGETEKDRGLRRRPYLDTTSPWMCLEAPMSCFLSPWAPIHILSLTAHVPSWVTAIRRIQIGNVELSAQLCVLLLGTPCAAPCPEL